MAQNLHIEQGEVGLCDTCLHMRRITSDRGADFFLCRLSANDPSFPKYPRLPVLTCRGFEEKDNPDREDLEKGCN